MSGGDDVSTANVYSWKINDGSITNPVTWMDARSNGDGYNAAMTGYSETNKRCDIYRYYVCPHSVTDSTSATSAASTCMRTSSGSNN
jgi:hypothetical protein